jgi:hypothetical protein
MVLSVIRVRRVGMKEVVSRGLDQLRGWGTYANEVY